MARKTEHEPERAKTLLSPSCNKCANEGEGHEPNEYGECPRCWALPHVEAEPASRRKASYLHGSYSAKCPKCGARKEQPCADEYTSCRKCETEFITDEPEAVETWEKAQPPKFLRLRRVLSYVSITPPLIKAPEEQDLTLYLRGDDGELTPVFCQINNEAKRIYCDFAPNSLQDAIDRGEYAEGSQAHSDAEEKHDAHDCLYFDFSEADAGLFQAHALYIEVEQ
jgi:hypothetical protein